MLFFAPSRQSILISSRHFAASASPRILRSFFSSSRLASSVAMATCNHQFAARRAALVAAMGVFAVINYHSNTGVLSCDSRIPSSGDVLSIGKITNEPATSISFPALCNGMSLAGVGVRIKYVFVKVYAVGAYFDPIAMMAVKKGNQAEMERALLDPTYPRTIRIVMNRGLSGTQASFFSQFSKASNSLSNKIYIMFL